MPQATSARIAEWILAQAFPTSRAAAAVGDWMEQAAERGTIWFWSCVVRTLVAHVWSDLTESPGFMARLGLIGFLLNILLPLLFLNIQGPFRHSDIRYLHDSLWTNVMIHVPKSPSFPAHWALRWQILLSLNLVWALSQFLTGRWIAGRVPGRELAGCAMVAMIGWLVILATEVLSWQGAIGLRLAVTVILPIGVAHDIVLFAAALLVRRHFHQPAAT